MQQKNIVDMFDKIAPTYDLVNKIVSFGVDNSWRKTAVKTAFSHINKNKIKILDVACGTGDMIDIWIKESKKNNFNAKIYGIDPSAGMLKVAKERFPNITFHQSFAISLPYEDNSIDILSISFGIRNVLEIDKALEEFRRVLKKDGTLLILEFVKSENNSVFRKSVDFYSNKVLPKIGGIISKNKEAYTYLPNSIQNFHTAKTLEDLLIKHNFHIKTTKFFNFKQVALILA